MKAAVDFLKGILHRLWLLVPDRFRLFVYRRLIDIGLHLYGSTMSSRTFRLPFNLYAKQGLRILESEAEAMRLVAARTTIPLPRVLDCIKVPDGAFILMTRLPGEPVFGGVKSMSPHERSLFAGDLKRCLQQLHDITAPDSRVSAIGGGPFRDARIQYEHHGPYASKEEFYESLYTHCPGVDIPRLREIAHPVHSKPHRLCLTHNDFSPQNILIENNRLSGIVDWEYCAWLPEWWEYTHSIYARDFYIAWIELMNEAHPETYPLELEVEQAFWRVTSPF